MKRFRALLYQIFIALGLMLLISRIVSRTFGLKELLLSNIRYLIGYEVAILLTVVLGMYIYHTRFADKTVESASSGTTKKKKDGLREKLQQTIDELCAECPAPAVILRSAPVDRMTEGHVSCLGRVTWQLPDEEWPVDTEGKRLEPLATLFVPDAPGVPAALRDIALITIYAPEEGWAEDPEEKPQLGCVIRTYPTLEGLVPCNHESATLHTCILTPEAVDNDMPKWPDCGIDETTWDAILALEKKHGIDYNEDICDAHYETLQKASIPPSFAAKPKKRVVYETHKFGGYPTYIQDSPEMPDDFPFVMQINFDSDAELYIGDVGSYYFYYNAETKEWRVYSDSY